MNLVDLYVRAEVDGIEVDDFRMREVVSASFPENWIAIDTRRIKTRKEEKVILAHEIGHCETGSFYNIYSPFDLRQKHENKANRRAYEILVPHDDLLEAVRKGIRETWELAEYFDVPFDFMNEAIEYWQSHDPIPCYE